MLAQQATDRIRNPQQQEKPLHEVTPGTFPELMPGQEMQQFTPTHPSMAFKDFTSTILRGQARGLNVSYLTLTGDLSAANYSSMRAGLLPERDHWRKLQKWLAIHCHRRVYRAWLPMALLTELDLDTRSAGDYRRVEWKPRGWKWVDPANDLDALEKEIMLGINSRQRACGERGVDFEDVVDELEYEQEYADEASVDVSPQRGGGQQADRKPTENTGTDNNATSLVERRARRIAAREAA
jgi:lambda family phage portal protein